MRNTVVALLIVALVAVLYLTNPSTEAFAERYADEINADLARELGFQGPLGGLLGGATQGLIQEALEQQTRRDNYGLASVFTVPAAEEDLRVLGIAGQFITLNGRGSEAAGIPTY